MRIKRENFMKKNIIAIVLFVITIVIGVGAVIILKNEPAKYTLNYTDNNNLYVIKVFDNKVTVNTKETLTCVKAPCETVDKNFKLTFNEDNTDKVYDVFKTIFTDDTKVKDINANVLSNEQKKVLSAVIINDDSSLEEVPSIEPIKTGNEDEADKKELLFTIRSGRINCLTVVLKVYEDNTYDLETASNVKPTTGTFTYDVKKIIENANKYEKNERGIYTLTTKKGETVTLYDTNKDLTDFLKEINVNLDTCIDFN